MGDKADGKTDDKVEGKRLTERGGEAFGKIKSSLDALPQNEKFVKIAKTMFVLFGTLLAITGMLIIMSGAGGSAGVFAASLGFVYIIIAALNDPPVSKYTLAIERKMNLHSDFSDFEEDFCDGENADGVDEISLLMIREYLDVNLKRGWLAFKWGVVLGVLGAFLFTVSVGSIAVSGADIGASAVFVLPGMMTSLASAVLLAIYALQQKQLSAHYVQMIENERRKSAIRLADKLSGEERNAAYMSLINAEIKRNCP